LFDSLGVDTYLASDVKHLSKTIVDLRNSSTVFDTIPKTSGESVNVEDYVKLHAIKDGKSYIFYIDLSVFCVFKYVENTGTTEKRISIQNYR
jgi:hypothetical protein